MKKTNAILVGILTLILSLFCLVGCGAQGTYKFDSLTVSVLGQDETFSVGQKYEGEELDENYFTIELKKDDVAVFGGKENLTCTWKEEDGKITFSSNGVTIATATRDGNTMTIAYKLFGTGMTFTLKK